jgi:hypothetical protein
MNLPIISNEQNNVLIELENNNVIVDSVAGSGKTTTVLHITKKFNNLKILLLTYNAKLKIETRQKADNLKLKNLEVHSYHSFCVKYYDNQCFTDSKILDLLKYNNNQNDKKFKFDLIILDEAQDITPTYFELICKIYKDNNETIKFCLLGDRYQSIYDFNNADERFIVFAEQLFCFNKFFWSNCKLTESYRISFEMSDFINNCMLNYSRIKANKILNYKPRYIICDTFGHTDNLPFDEIKYYLKNYLPEDIFVIAPSIKTKGDNLSPIRTLENKIKNELKDIPIYIPSSDEEKINEDVLKNKLCFSTFHQTKGLERKVVIVYGFDNSYFKYYKKNHNPLKCPNELYVACTRGIEHLTIFHHYEHNYLPFINKNNLSKYTNLICHKKLYIKNIELNKNNSTSVTDLIKHLPQNIIDNAVNFLNYEIIKNKSTKINIPIITIQKYGSECVSDITGVAIPAYFELKLKNQMTIFDEVCTNKIIFSKNNLINTKIHNDDFIDSDDDEQIIINYDLSKINIQSIKENELLYISNKYQSLRSGLLFKICQINDYNWLTKQNLNLCLDRLNNLNISKNTIFEEYLELENKIELSNRKLIGYCDCNDKDNNTIYEFKCVEELEKEHYLQLASYMYLYENYKLDMHKINKKYIIKESKYYLFNILTDELIKISCSFDNLQKMMDYLIYHKYNNIKETNDDVFISKLKNISQKFIE